MKAEVQRIISKLKLAPLAREGGWFRRTWTGPSVGLLDGPPPASAILFLMTRDNFSALHRLAWDEIWHFHSGDPVEHITLDPESGRVRVTKLGPDIRRGHRPQAIVPGRCWQGACCAPRGRRGWSLVGCTMAPGWDEADFVLGERAVLLRRFRRAGDLIRALTR